MLCTPSANARSVCLFGSSSLVPVLMCCLLCSFPCTVTCSFDPGQEATAGIDAETNDHPSAGGNSADTRRHQRQPLVALPGDYCIAVSNTAAAASSSSSSNGDGNTARNMMPDRSALNTEACDRITRCCRLGITSVSDVFGVRGSCGGGSGGGGSSGGGGHVKLSVRAGR